MKEEKKKKLKREARKWWPKVGEKSVFGLSQWTVFLLCFIAVLLIIWELIYYSRHAGG